MKTFGKVVVATSIACLAGCNTFSDAPEFLDDTDGGRSDAAIPIDGGMSDATNDGGAASDATVVADSGMPTSLGPFERQRAWRGTISSEVTGDISVATGVTEEGGSFVAVSTRTDETMRRAGVSIVPLDEEDRLGVLDFANSATTIPLTEGAPVDNVSVIAHSLLYERPTLYYSGTLYPEFCATGDANDYWSYNLSIDPFLRQLTQSIPTAGPCGAGPSESDIRGAELFIANGVPHLAALYDRGVEMGVLSISSDGGFGQAGYIELRDTIDDDTELRTTDGAIAYVNAGGEYVVWAGQPATDDATQMGTNVAGNNGTYVFEPQQELQGDEFDFAGLNGPESPFFFGIDFSSRNLVVERTGCTFTYEGEVVSGTDCVTKPAPTIVDLGTVLRVSADGTDSVLIALVAVARSDSSGDSDGLALVAIAPDGGFIGSVDVPWEDGRTVLETDVDVVTIDSDTMRIAFAASWSDRTQPTTNVDVWVWEFGGAR